MTYIKRTDVLAAMIAGRTCLTVSSYPDGSVTVAEVDSLRAGDIEIDKSEFNTLLAAIASAPVTPVAAPPDPDAELTNAIAAATTLAELKDALLGNKSRGMVKGRAV